MKPSKPVESQHLERTVDELLRDINFMLSRMAVLASALVPKLRKIIGDARASKVNSQAWHPYATEMQIDTLDTVIRCPYMI